MLNISIVPNFSRQKLQKLKKRANAVEVAKKEKKKKGRIKMCLGENHPTEIDLLNERRKI